MPLDIIVGPVDAMHAASVALLSAQLGYPVNETEAAKRISHLATSANDLVLGAFAAGKLVGWIHVGYRITMESGSFCEILGLIIDEQNRGCDIGKLLVSKAIEWAQARKCGRLVVRSNIVREDAHLFYLRRGFVVRKQQKVFDLAL